MRCTLLTVLRCPACGSAVVFVSSATDGSQIESGTLKCLGCERSYAIIDSVPRMLVEENLDRHSVKEGYAKLFLKNSRAMMAVMVSGKVCRGLR